MDIMLNEPEARALSERLRKACESVHLTMTVREAMEIDQAIRDAGFLGVYVNGGNVCDSIHDHFLTVAGMLDSHVATLAGSEVEP